MPAAIECASEYPQFSGECLVILYETDEEKVEAIKSWWKENGVSIVAGVAIGLGAIFAWRAWVDYRDAMGQQASAAFEQLLVSANSGDAKSGLAQAKLLSDEYPSSTYATLASLVQARVELEASNSAGARAALERGITGSPDPGIRRIAALRLARLLVAEGELDAAAALVAKHDDGGSFAGAFAAVRGDIAQAQGRSADARAAYEHAIAGGAPNPELLRLKLDNLPPAG
jgi:predicted negative regulator of RcsB-dependent stress response